MIHALQSARRRASVIGQFLGVAPDNTSHAEKFISGLGAGLGILAVYGALCGYAHDQALMLLMASVAASAVLVFAVPHGALSQPWPVLGSYLVSGLVGVWSHQWFGSTALAALLAVGLSVIAMHYLRCLHPPGGAVALTAVTAGPELQQLGYWFVLSPVLVNACALVLAGFVYNSLFPWRRYPVHMLYLKPHQHPLIKQHHLLELTHDDYQYALRKQDSFMDISPEDLAELVDCAREHALLNRRKKQSAR